MITPELFAVEIRKFLDDIDANMDETTLVSYYERLNEELDDESFLKAVERLRREWTPYGKPYPSKLEFIRAAELSEDEIEEAANFAYQLAKETAIFEGSYVSPDFEDPLIADVINEKFGSWFDFHNEVAYLDSDDTWAKRDFIESYKRKAKNKRVKKVKLIGYGKNPRPLRIKCNYNIPIKEKDIKQLDYKQNKATKLIANLANQKRIGI
jgi:hypothetical protein